MAPQAVPWCPRVVELVSSLAHDSLHLSHTGSLKSSPEAYLELVPSTGICITHSLGWVCPACLAAGHPFQAQGCATKAVAGEGVEDRWCLVPLWREKTHCSSWCSAWLFGCSFFFFLSQGAEGEMVFPTEETPFKSDNTTELFNSGQPLPLPCSGGFGTRHHRGCSWLVGRALLRAPTS